MRSFREEAMGTRARGFCGRHTFWSGALRRLLCSVGSALLVGATLGASGIEFATAATSSPQPALATQSTLSLQSTGATGAIGGSVATVATGPTGSVNRTVPKVPPPSPLSFSAIPADGEFLRTGLFVEALAPVSTNTGQDNRDLAQALLAYRDAVRETGGTDAVEPILALATHPG
jgi:hypothetical protein